MAIVLIQLPNDPGWVDKSECDAGRCFDVSFGYVCKIGIGRIAVGSGYIDAAMFRGPQSHGLILVEIGPGLGGSQVEGAVLFFGYGPDGNGADTGAPEDAQRKGVAENAGIVLGRHGFRVSEPKINCWALFGRTPDQAIQK